MRVLIGSMMILGLCLVLLLGLLSVLQDLLVRVPCGSPRFADGEISTAEYEGGRALPEQNVRTKQSP